jgi:L-cysteine desulfidase
MPRRVFFSFDYKNVYKVGLIVKNLSGIIPTSAAGFSGTDEWEEKKVLGDVEVQQMIDHALEETTVSVIFITEGAVNRKYINYEIYQSLARGNGLVAVQIHHLPDKDGHTDAPGDIPSQIADNGFKAYKFSNAEDLCTWIEEAALIAGK